MHSENHVINSPLIIGSAAGEGYTYLKSAMWWTGMILSKDPSFRYDEYFYLHEKKKMNSDSWRIM